MILSFYNMGQTPNRLRYQTFNLAEISPVWVRFPPGSPKFQENSMNFRHWCYEKWQEHCEEVRSWTGQDPLYLSAEYFNKYKWWLRREYRATVACHC